MGSKFVLRGGRIIDGTGAASRPGTVVVADGRVVSVGQEPAAVDAGSEVIDLDGLAVAPGFIDIHTHYDAQALWDSDFTPSSWHGVTTVVMGNCGFGLAPTRPEHRGLIARTLENVEGMTYEALEAGITWEFETFPEYLALLDERPKRCNVGAFVGHTPVRLYVMGTDASERSATDAELAQMQAIVTEALVAGALGFATSNSGAHVGAAGRPVPSRLADFHEYSTLARPLGELGRGIMQATFGPELGPKQFAELAEMTGRPVTWTALLTGQHDSTLAVLDEQSSYGGQVWPQVACRPLVAQLTLAEPYLFGRAAAFREVLALPPEQRTDCYRDESWRGRARVDVEASWSERWAKTTVQESERHRSLVEGATMADLAAAQGRHPLDVVLDLALEESLRTRFRVVLCNDDEQELADMLRDPRTLLGLSDAGAHVSQLCDACFSTYLLEHWVRETGVLSLEQAVWRLTGHPASVLGFADRGVLRPGARADLVVFDPDTVGVDEMRRVRDFPGGADRLVAQSRGVHHMWVNGEPTRLEGADLAGRRPGVLLRSSRP
jgi:N-acyl-D-aspartate/D-glutamate deacylase